MYSYGCVELLVKILLLFSANQPEMKCGERVKLIEEHIRLIQQKWSDLKSEVAHLDRRRRRARRKEREGTSTIAVLVCRVAILLI